MIKQTIEWLEAQGQNEVSQALIIAFAFSWLTAKAAKLLFSEDFKDSVALWFTGAVDEKHWSTSFNQLFDAFFSKKHFSLNCFLRSAIASVIVVAILYWILGNQERIGAKDTPWWIFLVGALVINAIADYISLLETRWLLQKINDWSEKYSFVTIPVLVIDLLFTGLIIWGVIWIYQFSPLHKGEIQTLPVVIAVFSPLSVFFYSTFLTSFWIWFYLLSLWILRMFRRLKLTEILFRGTKTNPVATLSFVVFLVSFSIIILAQGILKKEDKGGLTIDLTFCKWFPSVCKEAIKFTVDEKRRLKFLTNACKGGVLVDTCYKSALAKLAQESEIDIVVDLLAKVCEGGDPRGCDYVGWMYRNGGLVPRNDNIAISYYYIGCGLDDARACDNLGWMNANGVGTKIDIPAALEYYKKGCNLGLSKSCKDIGWRFNGGHGVRANLVEAVRFYKKGCELNNHESCFSLGWMYRTGQGVEQDYQKALRYYSQACGNRHAESCNHLGSMHFSGQGVPKNKLLAESYDRIACEYGFDKGCNTEKD